MSAMGTTIGEKHLIIGCSEGTTVVNARFGSLIAFEVALTLCLYRWLAFLPAPVAES